MKVRVGICMAVLDWIWQQDYSFLFEQHLSSLRYDNPHISHLFPWKMFEFPAVDIYAGCTFLFLCYQSSVG